MLTRTFCAREVTEITTRTPVPFFEACRLVSWSVRRTKFDTNRLTKEGEMRNGILSKSYGYTRRTERWMKVTLFVIGAAITRIGVFLLVGR